MSIYIWLPANLNQAFLEVNIPILYLNEVQQVLMREKTNLYRKYYLLYIPGLHWEEMTTSSVKLIETWQPMVWPPSCKSYY